MSRQIREETFERDIEAVLLQSLSTTEGEEPEWEADSVQENESVPYQAA